MPKSTRYDPAAIETIAGPNLVLEILRASRDVFAYFDNISGRLELLDLWTPREDEQRECLVIDLFKVRVATADIQGEGSKYQSSFWGVPTIRVS